MLVQHDGFIGVYSHLGLVAPPILEGRRTFAAGEQLGTVGRSGMTSGPHMFFEMIVNGKPVDPAPYLRLPPCGRAATADADRLTPTSLRSQTGGEFTAGKSASRLAITIPAMAKCNHGYPAVKRRAASRPRCAA